MNNSYIMYNIMNKKKMTVTKHVINLQKSIETSEN